MKTLLLYINIIVIWEKINVLRLLVIYYGKDTLMYAKFDIRTDLFQSDCNSKLQVNSRLYLNPQ